MADVEIGNHRHVWKLWGIVLCRDRLTGLYEKDDFATA
jgi:hypothetical protein